jgi:patatin-like phospholipase/acyl hydrolase
MPCLVLAIDGGGLRGIIPVLILKHIEQKVQASTNSDNGLVSYFNLISGTSTGGLIACAMTLASNEDTLSTRYDFDFIEEVYRNRGREIFPYNKRWLLRLYQWFRKFFRPKFKHRGIEKVLQDVFESTRISNCIRPIVIPTYDVSCNEPYYFSSREAWEKENMNHRLTDVCRATSAGPTYLPAQSLREPRPMICVDGGIFQNNPTITAIVEVLKNPDVYNQGKPLTLDDIFVLSIGTGRHNKIMPAKHAFKGGELHWAVPAIDISMWGNSQAVDEHTKRLFLFPGGKKHYLRLNVRILEEEFADLANSTSAAMKHYTERFNEDYVQNAELQRDLDQWLVDSGILSSETIQAKG